MEDSSQPPVVETIDQTQPAETEEGGYVSPAVAAAKAGERVEMGMHIQDLTETPIVKTTVSEPETPARTDETAAVGQGVEETTNPKE